MSKSSKKTSIPRNKLLAIQMVELVIKETYGLNARLIQADVMVKDPTTPLPESVEEIVFMITVSGLIAVSGKKVTCKTNFECMIKNRGKGVLKPHMVTTGTGLFWFAPLSPYATELKISPCAI